MKQIRWFLISLCFAFVFVGCEETINYAEVSIVKTMVESYETNAKITIQLSNSYSSISEYGVYLSRSNSNLSETGRVYKVNKPEIEWIDSKPTMSITLSELTANTTYYVQAFIRNTSGSELVGDVVKFTTDVKITVTTNTATNISTTSAILSGKVSLSGNVAISERGFVISTTNSTPTTTNCLKKYPVSGTTGTYSQNCTNLAWNKKYYFRAYVIINDNVFYGVTKNFTTLGSSYLGSQLSDFTGYYSCRAYNWDDDKYETWSDVRIYSYTTSDYENAVAVEGLLWGHSYHTAIGQYDAANRCIRLDGGRYLSGRTFTFTGNSTEYYSAFWPVYAGKGSSDFDVITSGNGYQGRGDAWLTFDSNGKLILGPANNRSYGANGMLWRYYLVGSSTTPTGRFKLFIEVELTKKTVSIAPSNPTIIGEIEEIDDIYDQPSNIISSKEDLQHKTL